LPNAALHNFSKNQIFERESFVHHLTFRASILSDPHTIPESLALFPRFLVESKAAEQTSEGQKNFLPAPVNLVNSAPTGKK